MKRNSRIQRGQAPAAALFLLLTRGMESDFSRSLCRMALETMRIRWTSSAPGFCCKAVLFLAAAISLQQALATAQTLQPIPATAAFNDSPVCSSSDLSNNTDLARVNPEWKPILIDPNHPIPYNPPTILEGVVPPPPESETSKDTAHSEVAEEDIPWNHYTHDFTFKVVPDAGYQYLLSSWVNADGTVGVHGDMEVEWENASLMDEGGRLSTHLGRGPGIRLAWRG